jgi:hypothetical protein
MPSYALCDVSVDVAMPPDVSDAVLRWREDDLERGRDALRFTSSLSVLICEPVTPPSALLLSPSLGLPGEAAADGGAVSNTLMPITFLRLVQDDT